MWFFMIPQIKDIEDRATLDSPNRPPVARADLIGPFSADTDGDHGPRSITDHAADALDNAPPYVREIITTLSDLNANRLAAGRPMVNGDGTPVPLSPTWNQFLNRD
jgi:hypothetical protein